MEIWGGNGAHDSGISVPGLDIWVYSQPHAGDRQGGDIHYISMCGSGRITRLAVADVAGHGDSVGQLATSLRSLMRQHINTVNQTKFARALNREFTHLSTGGTFATALLATYFAPNDHLILVNAGHPPPLWYRADRSEWRIMRSDMPERAERVANLPLGIIEPTRYEQFAVPLARGDMVLIYTDSLVEARPPDGEMLGEQGLLDLVASLNITDAQALRPALIDAVTRYRGNTPAEDDMTLVLIHHNAADPPWPGVGQTLKSIAKMMGLMKY